MLSAVKSEVKKGEHKDLGCHVLVIMTHGGLNNHIYGTDLKRVKLTDVYDLLTPLNFPGMAGKPKVVILEVCSGGNHFIKDLWSLQSCVLLTVKYLVECVNLQPISQLCRIILTCLTLFMFII